MSEKAIKHLKNDLLLKKVIDNTVLEDINRAESVYESLLRSIISQQLSVKVAATIHGRFIKLFKDQYPAPEQLLKMDIEVLRSAGLSRQKASYVQNVANFFIKENLLNQQDWKGEKDEEIIEKLITIKGVGKWTVQMILMFTLDRPDVFPIDDLGIQQAMIRLYKLEDKYTKDRQGKKDLRKKLLQISEPWSPFRTLACRYLWRWG